MNVLPGRTTCAAGSSHNSPDLNKNWLNYNLKQQMNVYQFDRRGNRFASQCYASSSAEVYCHEKTLKVRKMPCLETKWRGRKEDAVVAQSIDDVI